MVRIHHLPPLEIHKENSGFSQYFQLFSEVPAPKQIGPKTFLFPKVIDAAGNVLATNAVFGKLTGRRLSFWPETGPPLSLDVEKVHPAILRYLEINPETAKQSQLRIDAAWRIKP